MKVEVESCNHGNGHTCWIHANPDRFAEIERRLLEAFDYQEVHIWPGARDYGARSIFELVNSDGKSQALSIWTEWGVEPERIIYQLAFPDHFPESVRVVRPWTMKQAL